MWSTIPVLCVALAVANAAVIPLGFTFAPKIPVTTTVPVVTNVPITLPSCGCGLEVASLPCGCGYGPTCAYGSIVPSCGCGISSYGLGSGSYGCGCGSCGCGSGSCGCGCGSCSCTALPCGCGSPCGCGVELPSVSCGCESPCGCEVCVSRTSCLSCDPVTQCGCKIPMPVMDVLPSFNLGVSPFGCGCGRLGPLGFCGPCRNVIITPPFL